MITLKPARQLPLPLLDQHPPRRPTLVQGRVNADNLTHRLFPRIGVRPIREPHTQPVAEMLFQGGVIGLRRCHGGFEQHPPVNGQPATVQGLHLVRHRHMSVQIRITGAAISMRKRRCYQAAHVHLPDPLRPLTGKQSMLLQELERVAYGGVVGPLDLRGDLRVGDRPQRRHRLHR